MCRNKFQLLLLDVNDNEEIWDKFNRFVFVSWEEIDSLEPVAEAVMQSLLEVLALGVNTTAITPVATD